MSKGIKIRHWSVVGDNSNPYNPPELRTAHLQGNVYGHPRFPDGTQVRTSAIKDVKKRTVFTQSGSKYVLGNISSRYREWLHENRPNWNWRKPITIYNSYPERGY